MFNVVYLVLAICICLVLFLLAFVYCKGHDLREIVSYEVKPFNIKVFFNILIFSLFQSAFLFLFPFALAFNQTGICSMCCAFVFASALFFILLYAVSKNILHQEE